jgi:hypothetical protein
MVEDQIDSDASGVVAGRIGPLSDFGLPSGIGFRHSDFRSLALPGIRQIANPCCAGQNIRREPTIF